MTTEITIESMLKLSENELYTILGGLPKPSDGVYHVGEALQNPLKDGIDDFTIFNISYKREICKLWEKIKLDKIQDTIALGYLMLDYLVKINDQGVRTIVLASLVVKIGLDRYCV